MSLSVFRERLQSLRRKEGWSQQDVADRLGIPRSSYAGYENGSREPDFEMLVRLAELFGVSSDYLLGVTDDPRPARLHATISRIEQSVAQLGVDDKRALIAIIEAFLGARGHAPGATAEDGSDRDEGNRNE